MTKRNSMVFIVTDNDRELMEAYRARRGLRSLADALRTMIRDTQVPTDRPVVRTVEDIPPEMMRELDRPFGPVRPKPGALAKGKK